LGERLSSGLYSKPPDMLDDHMGPETYTLLETYNAPALCYGAGSVDILWQLKVENSG
jgi:hypothetical protein